MGKRAGALSTSLPGGDEWARRGFEPLNRFTKREIRPIRIEELVAGYTTAPDARLPIFHRVVGGMPQTAALHAIVNSNR